MNRSTRYRRVLQLPPEGRLLICTDLHGNLRDFERMREVFLDRRSGGPCQLLLTGDLIHGPDYGEDQWPDYLGRYYADQSGELVEAFVELARAYPHQVHCLLGNHEHSHVGGPHTPKFWEDETAHFEQVVGAERAARYNDLFVSFPFVAAAPCGVVVLHAAPNVEISTVDEIEHLPLDGYEQMNIMSINSMPPLGRMLWSRRCPERIAARFLQVMSADGATKHLAVFGHDIAAAGYDRIDRHQLVLSTSFGLKDDNKTFVELDLAGCYRSTDELVEGQQLRPLYG